MTTDKLDPEEKEILDSFEKGEWNRVDDKNRRAELKSYAKATLAKDTRITLRLSSLDLQAIQAKAVEEGIPYQTLIASVLHKFATGRLVDTRHDRESGK